VEAGERLGFLPGDYRDKVDPYLRPLYDALEDMIPREKLTQYMEQNVVEIAPIAYMRGRTLHSSFVILDEAQNATTQQMKMFLTRLGTSSRSIVTGDITQIDLASRFDSGLIQARSILPEVDGISFVYFDTRDVVRHKLVKDIIAAYEKMESDKTAGDPST
jgi:phosphate starvation-inducible PhoH-like protein